MEQLKLWDGFNWLMSALSFFMLFLSVIDNHNLYLTTAGFFIIGICVIEVTAKWIINEIRLCDNAILDRLDEIDWSIIENTPKVRK